MKIVLKMQNENREKRTNNLNLLRSEVATICVKDIYKKTKRRLKHAHKKRTEDLICKSAKQLFKTKAKRNIVNKSIDHSQQHTFHIDIFHPGTEEEGV